MVNLSRLEEIKDLRTVWPHEALDFTPWLSQDDNIALLADAVGLDITVDETESSVGDFNVDIFASETGTDRKIIIENQLEDTNHDHLGELITYASGKSRSWETGTKSMFVFPYQTTWSFTNHFWRTGKALTRQQTFRLIGVNFRSARRARLSQSVRRIFQTNQNGRSNLTGCLMLWLR